MKYFTPVQSKSVVEPAFPVESALVIPHRETSVRTRPVYGHAEMRPDVAPRKAVRFETAEEVCEVKTTVWSATETLVSTTHRTERTTTAVATEAPTMPPPPPAAAGLAPEQLDEEDSEERNFLKLMHRLNFTKISRAVWRKRLQRHLWAELVNPLQTPEVYLTNGSDMKIKLQLSNPASDIRLLNTLLASGQRSALEKHRYTIIKSLFLFLAGAAGVLVGFNVLRMLVS